jgi:DNA helicase HerA-like ATPase
MLERNQTTNRQPVPVGETRGLWSWRPHSLPADQVASHVHVIGVSGSGKSRFLARFYLDLIRRGYPASLIDPHGDLARLVLAQLVASGLYRTEDAYTRVLYLDLPAAERAGRFLPFNILALPDRAHTVAGKVKEAFHRAFPELAHGAPMFDTLVQDGVKVLASAGLPLTSLFRLLTDKPFRDQLLSREQDPDIVAFFRGQFDRLAPRDQADQAGAALRRAHLLTFAPLLKYSLGQSQLALNFRRIIEGRQSVILNLAVDNPDAKRLLGCLLTVSAVHGAKSRAELSVGQRAGTHHLFIDEFHLFTDQSEAALAEMLSETRKYGLYLVMAHQDWTQASARLKGALANAGLEVVFRLGRDDAEYTARKIGRVDPKTTRQDLTRAESESAGMAEQWERQVQAIQDLRAREAFIRPPTGAAVQVRTLPMADPVVDAQVLAAVEQRYLALYFRPQQAIEQELARLRTSAPTSATRRVVPLKNAA